MGLYINFEDVRIRLIGKVRFTEDENEENKMHTSLANKLIKEAESQVEVDLSPRYYLPFQHHSTGKFKDLPANPTQNVIKTLCELMAVKRILETDFGTGTAVDADKYMKKLEKRYSDIVNDSLLAKVKNQEDQRQWLKPPLVDLRKAHFNTEADDGYAGMVLVTSQGDGNYPSVQTSDPSENFWNGDLDDL